MTEAVAVERLSSRDLERSLRSYFDAFAPAPEWDDLVSWPPDVFALANLVLDHTASYRFAVAPPPGRHWPPLRDWNAEVGVAAKSWAEAWGRPGGNRPALVCRSWNTVNRLRDVSLEALRRGEAWELIEALLTLHAIADEASAGIASGAPTPDGSFEQEAARLLESTGSLSRVSPTRVLIVPKTNFSPRGMTIRSLSRYLGLCYEAVRVKWRRCEAPDVTGRDDYNLVLLPWPLSVEAGDFRPAPPALLENMDHDRFGFFEFAPRAADIDSGLVATLLEEAVDVVGTVDAVVLPEVAVRPDEIAVLEQTVSRYGATFLMSGVRERARATAQGRNYLHLGVRRGNGWARFEQDKHHRWSLDDRQIRQYHLTRALSPKKLWWEAIGLRERMMNIIGVREGITAAPLVCEDLASLDEVADLVRRIGPSLVVALLLDGPQLAARWPCRYSSVLVDDPGSAVLTLTSYGMVKRCRPPGRPSSRVVAHWNSPVDGVRELRLEPHAAGVLLSTALRARTLWTADGRRHAEVPYLELSGVRQLY